MSKTPDNISRENKQENHKETPGLLNLERFIPRLINKYLFFIISIVIALIIVEYQNRWGLKETYRVANVIHVGDKKTNASSRRSQINFLWVGTSDKLERLKEVLKSRKHNEEIVKRLTSYVLYQEEGRFKSTAIHKSDSPFYVELTEGKSQPINRSFEIVILPSGKFKITTDKGLLIFYNYENKKSLRQRIELEDKEYRFGELVALGENSSLRIHRNFKVSPHGKSKYSFSLLNYDTAVSRMASSIQVKTREGMLDVSLMYLSMRGENVKQLVENLNESTDLLVKRQLSEKNEIPLNTINFIQSKLSDIKHKLDISANNKENVRTADKIIDIGKQADIHLEKLVEYETEKSRYQTQIEILNQTLLSLNSGTRFTSPSIIFVEKDLFTSQVYTLDKLYKEKQELLNIYQAGTTPVREKEAAIQLVNEQIRRTIRNYIRNIRTKIAALGRSINKENRSIRNLPRNEQRLLNVEREYKVNDIIYTDLLTFLNENEIIIASNIPDVEVIEPATLFKVSRLTPNKNKNRLMALFAAIIFPGLLFLIIELFDTKIKVLSDITHFTSIPIVGTVGASSYGKNTVVLDRPKSRVSESFRLIRANIRTLTNKEKSLKDNTTLLITSSVGGEGKTFLAINMATVFALSGKKTLLMGLDLRKPKLYKDFDVNNQVGLTSYLSGNTKLEEIIHSSKLDSLDILVSGAVPLNPLEMLLSKEMETLMSQLKETYDYIVLDTPPLVLVADASELMKFSDVNLYVTRHEYSERSYLNLITEKYEEGTVKNIGIVLNDFKNKRGYSYDYGYGYGYGYFEEDDEYKLNIVDRIRRLVNKKHRNT